MPGHDQWTNHLERLRALREEVDALLQMVQPPSVFTAEDLRHLRALPEQDHLLDRPGREPASLALLVEELQCWRGERPNPRMPASGLYAIGQSGAFYELERGADGNYLLVAPQEDTLVALAVDGRRVAITAAEGGN